MSDASRDGLVQMSDQELADYLDRVAAGRDWVREAARRLRAFIRDVRPGGCGIYSQGAACQCPLCDVDRLALAWHGERPATPECWCGLDTSKDGYRSDIVCPKHDGDFPVSPAPASHEEER